MHGGLVSLAGPLMALGLALLPSVPEPVESWLAGATVECQTLKSWSSWDSDHTAEPWLHFDVSCHLPEASPWVRASLRPAVIETIPSADGRYVATAALAALGRLAELPPAERARFVLEIARRENEPFASASIGFVFGDTPWWDSDDPEATYTVQALGYLAAPWDESMVPVLREYLSPAVEGRAVSTLAVYLCTQMVPQLDESVVPELERVVRLQPDSMEADMARSVLSALRQRLSGNEGRRLE